MLEGKTVSSINQLTEFEGLVYAKLAPVSAPTIVTPVQAPGCQSLAQGTASGIHTFNVTHSTGEIHVTYI